MGCGVVGEAEGAGDVGICWRAEEAGSGVKGMLGEEELDQVG